MGICFCRRDAERGAKKIPSMKFGWLAWLEMESAERGGQIWLRVAHNPLSRREALDALFEIYRASNDLPNLYLTAMRLHVPSPENRRLRQNLPVSRLSSIEPKRRSARCQRGL